MTLNQMLAKTRQYIDERSEKSFLNTDIIDSINIAQRSIQQIIVSFDKGYFERDAELNPITPTNPIAGTIPQIAKYALPTDFIGFKLIWRKDTGKKLTPVSGTADKLITGTLYPPTTAEPWEYDISGNNVIFYPTPQDYYPLLMTYIYIIPDLALGTDTSELPTWLHDWCCVEAAIDCLIQDEADITPLETKVNKYKGLLLTTLDSRQVQEPGKVTVVEDDYRLYDNVLN